MKKLFFAALVLLTLLTSTAFASTDTTPTLKYTITGISDPAILENVTKLLNSERDVYQKKLTPEIITELSKNAHHLVKQATEPFGYYHPTVTETLTHQENQWTSLLNVTLGNPLLIQTLNVTLLGAGANNPVFQKFLSTLPLKKNDILTTAHYKMAEKNFFTAANADGFIKARVKKNEVLIDRENNTATINLVFQTGDQYYFGKPEFNNTTFSDDFLKRFLNFKPGEPFNTQKLVALSQAYTQSNYFDNVLVEPDTKNTHNKQVPILIKLFPKPSQEYRFGVGFGTATGPRATIGTTFNHIGSHGHYFDTHIQVSKVIQNLTAEYVIPGADPLKEQYSLRSAIVRQRPQDDQSEYANIALAYTSLFPTWQRTLALTLQHELFQINQQPANKATILVPSITYTRLISDALVDPQNGYKLSINLRGSARTLLSSTNFIQGTLTGRFLHSFWHGNSKILLHGGVGWTGTDDLSDFPLSLRFFTGGTDSIRGYGYEDIGPGTTFKLLGAEFQERIVGQWFATTFVDTGDASDSFASPLKTGAGIGVAWYSIVGPIQVNLSHAFNEPGKSLSIEFDLGTPL